MSKQDRQGVRTTQGLEQKYLFGRVFSNQAQENARRLESAQLKSDRKNNKKK
jgi:hypothetical protein